MHGGPRKAYKRSDESHTRYPTFSGQFTSYSIGKHTSHEYYPTYSSIPWGAPLRLNKSNEMEVQINGEWKNIKDIIPNPSDRPSVHDVSKLFSYYYGTKKADLEKFGFKVSSNQKFLFPFYLPDTWVLNDFGHVTVKMYKDKNKNKKVDSGEENREYFHPSPDIEAMISMGMDPNRINAEKLRESHGCIHVKPNDIDEMINKGYMAIGNQVIIHFYDDVPDKLGLREDSTGHAPFVIHVFPGFFKMIIEDEKLNKKSIYL